jgi:putative transposase
MDVKLHDPSDLAWLAERIDAERDARQRDRYRVVELALSRMETLEIAARVRRPRKFVQDWVYRYRDHGREGLVAKKGSGRPPKLAAEKVEAFKRRLDVGVREADGVCTLRGEDIRRILELEFGAVYQLNGVYEMLSRLGYSPLRPRPSHRKRDLAAQQKFKDEDAPLF